MSDSLSALILPLSIYRYSSLYPNSATLHSAYDNVINPSLIRSLIKDIRQARESKLRLGIIPKMNENPSDEGGINGEYLQVRSLPCCPFATAAVACHLLPTKTVYPFIH